MSQHSKTPLTLAKLGLPSIIALKDRPGDIFVRRTPMHLQPRPTASMEYGSTEIPTCILISFNDDIIAKKYYVSFSTSNCSAALRLNYPVADLVILCGVKRDMYNSTARWTGTIAQKDFELQCQKNTLDLDQTSTLLDSAEYHAYGASVFCSIKTKKQIIACTAGTRSTCGAFPREQPICLGCFCTFST